MELHFREPTPMDPKCQYHIIMKKNGIAVALAGVDGLMGSDATFRLESHVMNLLKSLLILASCENSINITLLQL
jgi:hypothetical protein